jgi:two-component system, OmpR family, phosphate regulon sensor histidine kinase PhoR
MDSVTNLCAARSDAERPVARAVLATIGHELRTPLTSIRGYIETLLDGEFDPPTARRFLETVRRETLRLGRLVDGLLEFSLLDLAADDHVACNAVEQVRATIDMLSPMASARGVTIHADLPDAAHALVDGDACVHALANLVENAVKYGREHGMVEVSCVREERFVVLAVDDNGGGIAPEARESIFVMGVRRDAAGRSGRGIGLAVVKAIAERAGGDVRVERSPLGGARFEVRFPAG